MNNRQRARADKRNAQIAAAAKLHQPPAAVAAAAFGLDSATAMDAFSNLAARMGYMSNSVAEGTDYSLVRWSNDYWLMITLYRNHWLPRRIVDSAASDMIRSWPNIISDMSGEDIKLIDRTIRKTYTPSKLLRSLKWRGLFGGAGALMVIDGHEDILDEPLELDDVNPGTYRGVIPFDRWSGITPGTVISEDINRPADFGLPEHYEIRTTNGQAFHVHSSRILRFAGADVPNPEFQASMYWGISELEICYEELRKRDNASWAMLQLLFRAQILAKKDPELAGILSGATVANGGLKRFWDTMSAQNQLLSNNSMLLLGKDGELQSSSYAFSGLGDTYQQFQLDVVGAARSTFSRIFGQSRSGLSTSNEAEEKLYEERIAMDCDEILLPQLEAKLYPVIMQSEFGEVPADFDLNFPSIRVLTEKEKSEIAKDGIAGVSTLWGDSLLTKRQAMREVQAVGRQTGIGTSITDEDIQAAPEKYIMELGGGDIPPGGEGDNGAKPDDDPQGDGGDNGEGDDD